MGDAYKTYSGYHYPNSSYEEGTCDFCHQRRVKVRPLLCMKHFFCRVCEDFAPKFKRRDYRCAKCSAKVRKTEKENLKMIDKCITQHVGGSGSRRKPEFHEVAISLGGSDVVTFVDGDIRSKDSPPIRKDRRRRQKNRATTKNNPVQTYKEVEVVSTSSFLVDFFSSEISLLDESDDSDDDMAGNNTQWDQLFEEMAGNSKTNTQQIARENGRDSSSHSMQQSFTTPSTSIRSNLSTCTATPTDQSLSPSVENEPEVCDDQPLSSAFEIKNTKAVHFQKQGVRKSSDEMKLETQGVKGHQHFNVTPYPSYSEMEEYQYEDDEEMERGTSPVKAYKRDDMWTQASFPTSVSGSESEIGEIESMSFYARSYSDECVLTGKKDDTDDFWESF